MKNIGYYDDEDTFHDLPHKWIICDHCNGEGRSSAYLGAFTNEDMGEDQEFFEDYMAGHYDRTCEYCKGSGKIKVIDKDKCNASDLKEYYKQKDEEYQIEAEHYAEWLHEGGWRELGWR